MAADREDDRRTRSAQDKDRAESSVAEQSRGTHVREQVYGHASRLRQNAQPGDAGHGIDGKLDRIASEQAMHTPGGRNLEVDQQVRQDLERHRREMQLAAIAGQLAKKRKRGPQAPEQQQVRAGRGRDTVEPGAEAFAKSRRQERAAARAESGREPGRRGERGAQRQQKQAKVQENGFARPGTPVIGGGGAAAPVRPGEVRTVQELTRERTQIREDQAQTR